MSDDHDEDVPGHPSDGPDYDVGYGRPPRHSQFRKGRSGNPGGRRQSATKPETWLEMLARIGRESATLRGRDGELHQVLLAEAAIRAQFVQATKGDTAAFRALSKFAERLPEVGRRRKTIKEWTDEETDHLTPSEQREVMALSQELERWAQPTCPRCGNHPDPLDCEPGYGDDDPLPEKWRYARDDDDLEE